MTRSSPRPYPPRVRLAIVITDDPDGVFDLAERLCVLAVEDPDLLLLPEYLEAQRKAQFLEHSGWKRKTGMTQNQIILKHLNKAGSITVREAIVEYSIQSLTKRVQELRESGNHIMSHVKYHPVTGQKYVRYTLESELYPHDIPHRKLRSAPVLRNRVGALVNHAKGVRY